MAVVDDALSLPSMCPLFFAALSDPCHLGDVLCLLLESMVGTDVRYALESSRVIG